MEEDIKLITICSICEKFKIKQFNLLYEEMLKLNINPMNVKINELSLLIFKEKKNVQLDDIILTTAKDKDDKYLFHNKWVKIKNKDDIIKNVKNDFEKEIDLIIDDLNQKRNDYFHLNTKFQKSITTIKTIKKYLIQGFKVEDFILVHENSAKIYLKHEDEKIATGFYFRPSTLYNGKFISRVENAKAETETLKLNTKSYTDKDIQNIIDDLNQKREMFFKLKQKFELKNNKEFIKKWLNSKYQIEDFLLVHEYIGQLYLENDNQKIASGFYFRPSTIYDEKFPQRVENAKNKLEFEKEEQLEAIENIEDIILKIKNNEKQNQ